MAGFNLKENIFLKTALEAAVVLFLFTFVFSKALFIGELAIGLSIFEQVVIYPSDLAATILVAVWLTKVVFERRLSFQRALKFSPLFLMGGLFLVLTLLSVLVSQTLLFGLVGWAQLLLAIGLFACLKQEWLSIKKIFLPTLVLVGVFESLVGLWQFASQKSVGLGILGEPALAPNLAGVAKVALEGDVLVRAYGTLIHPNVLAIFLAIGIFVLVGWYLGERNRGKGLTLFSTAAFPILLLGLFVTFSRAAIALTLAGLIALGIFVWRRFKDRRDSLKGLAAITLAAAIIFSVLFWPAVSSRLNFNPQDQAVSQRVLYAQISLEIIKQRPILGVGFSQYVPTVRNLVGLQLLPWMYEPVHNFYLLIAAQSGIFALLALLGFIFLRLREAISAKLTPWRAALILGALVFISASFFDHFALTTSAGRYLWWLVLGVI